MLIKITNQCSLKCSHCLEGSLPDTGQHMAWSTFQAALACTERVESLARQVTGYNLLLLSGGECTENPLILDMIDAALKRGFQPVLLSNGLWLSDPLLSSAILKRPVMVQVTNDPRFYPKAPLRVDHPKIVYIDALSQYIKLGRGVKLSPTTTDLPAKRYPGSFNLRSFTHTFGDLRIALAEHRKRALTGFAGGHCTPTISWDGAFVVGESRFCSQVGTVESSPEELTWGILGMGSCNRCGLETNLNADQKAAIGVP